MKLGVKPGVKHEVKLTQRTGIDKKSYIGYSVAAKVILPANFEDRLILIFLSSLDLELRKNARSSRIWAP